MFERERTCYPLFYPSATIFLMNNYSDANYLSCFHYQMEAGVVLGERYLEAEAISPTGNNCYSARNSLCNRRGIDLGAAIIQPGPSQEISRDIARQTKNIEQAFNLRSLGLINSQGYTINSTFKNYVMSDSTLIKLQRPQPMYERNFLVMYIQLQEEIITTSLYAQGKTTDTQILTMISEIIKFLTVEVNRAIELLNGY